MTRRYEEEQLWLPNSLKVSTWDMDFHNLMLGDQLRMRAYEKAIEETVKPGMVVLDLGTGTGVLALWALQAGAAHVYGVELNAEMLEAAVARMAEAGLAQRFRPILSLSYEARLPEPVDLIISEIMGNLGDNEDFVPILTDARRRFLKPGGLMLPYRVESFLVPVAAERAHAQLRQGTCRVGETTRPLDLALKPELGGGRFDSYYDVILPESTHLSFPERLRSFHFEETDSPDYELDLSFGVQGEGVFTGFKGYFVAALSPTVSLDISSGDIDGGKTSDSWKHCYLPIEEPVKVRVGDTIRLRFARFHPQRRRDPFEHFYRWRGEVLREGRVIARYGQDMEARGPSAVHGATASQAPALLDITQHEIQALKMKLNLADAHTHQRQSPSQRNIISRLPELWHESEESLQVEQERRFIEAFFQLRQQPTALSTQRVLLSYAASISTVVAAMYLVRRRSSVSLIEPCFDNLHDILKNMGVERSPVSEEVLCDPGSIYERLRQTVRGDVLFLVDPNNPTGFTLLRHGRKGFEEVVRYCKDHGKLLMLDLCFSSFAMMDERMPRFDLYELLESSGVTYITIEDTGKTWPVQDAKCALLTASRDIYEDIYNLQTSVLLNVSPFVLNMLTQYLRDSMRDGFASIFSVMERNRELAISAVQGSMLRYREPSARVSVAWFEIQDPRVQATELQRALACSGVYVLPGTYFYWSAPSLGERFVRLALAREPEMFSDAMHTLRRVLDDYAR